MRSKVNRKNQKSGNKGTIRRYFRSLLGITVLTVAIGSAGVGAIRFFDPAAFPIRSVQVEGTFKYLDLAQLQQAVAIYAGSSFFNLDIQHIQQTVKNIAWVDQVSVRRIWPDKIRIRVNEHVPLARWENNGLVNIRGEWFEAKQDASVSHLPEFSGPEGFSGKVTEKYRQIQKTLEPEGLELTRIATGHRRTWQIKLQNGIGIKLGKSKTVSRLNRFVRVYPVLLEQLSAGMSLEGVSPADSLSNKVGEIDLRYTNGFAIRWQRELKSSGLQGADLQKSYLQNTYLQDTDLLNRGNEKNV